MVAAVLEGWLMGQVGVSVTLGIRAFAFYHPECAQWITKDGDFDILIAANADDIRESVTVTLESTLDVPSILDKESTFNEWMADQGGHSILGSYYSRIKAEAR